MMSVDILMSGRTSRNARIFCLEPEQELKVEEEETQPREQARRPKEADVADLITVNGGSAETSDEGSRARPDSDPVEKESPSPGIPFDHPSQTLDSKQTEQAPAVQRSAAGSRLVWANADNGKNVSWKLAVKYCEELSKGRRDHWRLPTIEELQEQFKGARASLSQPKRSWLWSENKDSRKDAGNDSTQLKSGSKRKSRAGASSIQVTGPWLWSASKESEEKTWSYSRQLQRKVLQRLSFSQGMRALCVR